MLKIIVSTKTISNITVPKDSVVEFDPYFVTHRVYDKVAEKYKEQTSIIFTNKTWGKAADYQDGTTPELQEPFKQYGQKYKVALTDEQMEELEAGTGEFSNVFIGVQNIIIAAIENGWPAYTGVGEGNVEYYKAVF